jgi:3-hydroxybutyryl-CoA dehydrogenase
LPTSEALPITVAIIGAGPLGRWLALAAARAGYRVLLEDVMPANLHHAQEYLRQQLGPRSSLRDPGGRTAAPSTAAATPSRNILAEPGGLALVVSQVPESGPGAPTDFHSFGRTEGPWNIQEASSVAVQASLGGVAFVSTIEDAVRDADLVIDCVPDELESKLEILWLLDRMAPPRTVLATPTTRHSIADLANCTYRPEKCVAIAAEASSLTGNPASGAQGTAAGAEILLRTTSRTAPETVALLDGFWRKMGFTPDFAPDHTEKPVNSKCGEPEVH